MFNLISLQSNTGTPPELLFVYNANATVYAVTIDFFHKLFSPETYQCNLCRVTYGPVSMKREWKEFLASLPYNILFYHKDQFSRVFPEAFNMTFPVVFIRKEGTLSTVMQTDEINRISTVEELKQALVDKLKSIA